MSEPWMSVHAPESWPVGGDQFMTFSMPQHLPAAPFVNTPQPTTIQWSQSWDVPSSQKGFGGMMKSSMKSKGQTIEGFSAGFAKLSVREEPKPVEVPVVIPTPQPQPQPEPEEEEEEEDPDAPLDEGEEAPKSGKKKKQQQQQQQQQQLDDKGHPNIEDELSKQNLYKTELCRSFVETGICRYGHKCQFAHGSHELRPVLRHPKYKTEACKSFSITGQCPYGNRCRFIHQPGQLLNSGSSSLPNHTQSVPIPIGNNGAAEFGWSTSWSNAGTPSSPITSPAFVPTSASSNFSGNVQNNSSSAAANSASSSTSPSSTPSPGSSPNKSRDDNPRRLAFFQGLAN